MVFCSKCGKENLSANNFCFSCGNALSTQGYNAESQPPPLNYCPPFIRPTRSQSPLHLYIGCFKKYAQFDGRARRSEFWWFTAIDMLVFLALFTPGLYLTLQDWFKANIKSPSIFLILAGIYLLISWIPHLAVTARRLHDTGRSGKWIVLFILGGLVPLLDVILFIVFIVFAVEDSQTWANQYGPSPKDSLFLQQNQFPHS